MTDDQRKTNLDERKAWSLDSLASLLGGAGIGDPATPITGIAAVQEAEEGDLVFAETPKYLAAAVESRAAAVITSAAALGDQMPGKPVIVVDDPRLAFVRALAAFAPASRAAPGIHPSALISRTASLGANVSIAAGVTIGERVTIGEAVTLLEGVRVGDAVTIGQGSVLHPNVVLYSGVTIGRGCILHAGCVIGADGFGYVPVGRALQKTPHLGTVELGDEVEIGANSCIDRAKTGTTRIGSGTKVDNLVHIAHNVQVGRSCLIIAQTGIAGSVTIGDGVVLAGQSGIKDHVTLGPGSRVGAQGGVIGDVAAGVTVSGYPARPHSEKMRELAATAALPGYIRRIRDLEKRLASLEALLGERGG